MTQNRAHIPGYTANWSRTTLRMVQDARYAARNECAYALLRGFRGQSIIACAKKLRCRKSRTADNKLSYAFKVRASGLDTH